MNNLFRWVGLGFILIFSACAGNHAPAVHETPPAEVRYRDRTIDLNAFIAGYPFRALHFDLETNRVYYLKKGEQEFLYRLDFKPGEPIDLTQGKQVSPLDFSHRNFWNLKVSRFNGKAYILADADNAEKMNIYELDENTGALKPITHSGYVYSYDFNPSGDKLAYASRSGNAEFTPGQLAVVNLKDETEAIPFQDTFERRVTWGGIAWAKDENFVVVNTACKEDRTHQTLISIDLAGKGIKDLLPCDTKRQLSPIGNFVAKNSFIYSTNETDNDVLFKYSFGKKPQALTSKAWNLSSSEITTGKRPVIITVEKKPISSVVRVINPISGKVIDMKEAKETYYVDSVGDAGAVLTKASATLPFAAEFYPLNGKLGKTSPVLNYPASLLNKVVQCSVEKISFKTFDGTSAPGEKGTLHAFLYKPKNPATGNNARLLVEAFYGGVNSYSAKDHMFCAAGFYVLSPAPRGSWDWGREFHDLMQGDLGGKEIVDVMEAAKSVSKQLGIPENHVGAFGGSHGGYATLRMLTFPGSVSGTPEDFHFGFGIADYGISNLIRYYNTTNISGWITDMAGEDPNKNPNKWLDRSPETHAAQASGPIFLSAGSNDHRVNPDESRLMYKALIAAKKPATYYEIPGQGHGFKGTPVLEEYYAHLFGFLDQIQ